MGSCAVADFSASGTDLLQAIRGGTPGFSLRWRYEHVEDDARINGTPLKDANASTVRGTLGYRTAPYRGVSAYLQFEAIGALGLDDYHDGSGVGNRRFATVVDPEGVELNQGYLSWRAHERINITAGRRNLTYRNAPFHRFVGTVLWRQNWQTQDALTISLQPVEDLTLDYAYAWNINRIFGEDAPEPLSDFDSDSHLINLRYTGFSNVKFEAYAYLLDFDNAVRFSSHTFGLRGSGMYPITEDWGLVYASEFAHQSDAGDNPFSYGEEYLLVEGGMKWKFDRILKSATVKISYELLGGDGTSNGAFVTILGTNHAFQGWADRFLITPDNGIEDVYVTVVAPMEHDWKFIGSLHRLRSVEGSFGYGDEVDLLLSKKISKHFNMGTKASFYSADSNIHNVRGGPAADVTKVWVWAGLSF